MDFNSLPSRVKYYLLDYKDQYLEQFKEVYKTGTLRDLTPKELKEFWEEATDIDSQIFNV
jgi:hypothetical protein